MSDTPETDAEVNELKSATTYNMVWAEFARQLERELAQRKRELDVMTDQRDAAMQCHEWCRKDRKRIIKELIKVTEQRDRLAEALNRACANPTTGNWYREAQDAITAWKEARCES
jgi:hypothetical protein